MVQLILGEKDYFSGSHSEIPLGEGKGVRSNPVRHAGCGKIHVEIIFKNYLFLAGAITKAVF